MFQQRSDVEKKIMAFHLGCVIVAVIATFVSGWGCIEAVLDNKKVFAVVQAQLFIINFVLTIIIINFRAFSRTKLWCRIAGW